MATIDQIKFALERRGYTRETVKTTDQKRAIGSILVAIGHVTEVAGSVSPVLVGLLIDEHLGGDQHHVQHDCGFPLLRESKNTREHETLAYRAVRNGPTSKPLLECPQCLQYVQDDSVQEIRDEE